MQSNAELVKRVLDGDRDAFGALIRRYERAVCATAESVLRDHHLAQDVAQEAFLAAYVKLGSLREPAAFGPWVVRIARREASRLARRPTVVTLHEEQAFAQGASDDGVLDARALQLLEAVMRLPEREREVVILKYFEGYGVNEIADITARPVGTVTKQLSRARRLLRTRLGKRNHD